MPECRTELTGSPGRTISQSHPEGCWEQSVLQNKKYFLSEVIKANEYFQLQETLEIRGSWFCTASMYSSLENGITECLEAGLQPKPPILFCSLFCFYLLAFLSWL